MSRVTNRAAKVSGYGKRHQTGTLVKQLAQALERLFDGTDEFDPRLPLDVVLGEVRQAGGPSAATQSLHGPDLEFRSKVNKLLTTVRIDHFDRSRQAWNIKRRHTRGGAVHDEVRADPARARQIWKFNHVADLDGQPMEAFDCACGSTLYLRGIGPRQHAEDYNE